MHARPPPAACEETEVSAVHGGRHWRVKLQPEGVVISFVAYFLPRTVYLHIGLEELTWGHDH